MKNPILEYARYRIDNYKDCAIFIGGDLGSGKTATSLTLASEFDKDFKLENNFFQDLGRFYKALVREKVGEAIVYDEAQTGLDSRTWFDRLQQVVAKAQIVRRIKRKLIIVVSPFKEWIDPRVRQLFNVQIECEHVDWKNGFLYFKAYKFVRRIKPGGEVAIGIKKFRRKGIPIRKFIIPVNKKLYEEYQSIGQAFKEKLLQAPLILHPELKKLTEQEILEKITSDPTPWVKIKGGRLFIDHYKLMYKFNLSEKAARRIKGMAEALLRERGFFKEITLDKK